MSDWRRTANWNGNKNNNWDRCFRRVFSGFCSCAIVQSQRRERIKQKPKTRYSNTNSFEKKKKKIVKKRRRTLIVEWFSPFLSLSYSCCCFRCVERYELSHSHSSILPSRYFDISCPHSFSLLLSLYVVPFVRLSGSHFFLLCVIVVTPVTNRSQRIFVVDDFDECAKFQFIVLQPNRLTLCQIHILLSVFCVNRAIGGFDKKLKLMKNYLFVFQLTLSIAKNEKNRRERNEQHKKPLIITTWRGVRTSHAKFKVNALRVVHLRFLHLFSVRFSIRPFDLKLKIATELHACIASTSLIVSCRVCVHCATIACH